MNNVTQLPGTQHKETPEETKASMIAGIKLFLTIMPEQIEYAKIQAKMRKAKYDALLAEGFTEAQALDIVKSTPPIE